MMMEYSELPLQTVKLKLDRHFQPCASQPGDELYPNGIFEFNITRLLAFIRAHAERFPTELVKLADIPDYGGIGRLDEAAIQVADPSRPILMAEIAPSRYNVIDGNHRVAKARRCGADSIAVDRVRCPDHVAFLTSTRAYEAYVEYWNDKVSTTTRAARARQQRRNN